MDHLMVILFEKKNRNHVSYSHNMNQSSMGLKSLEFRIPNIKTSTRTSNIIREDSDTYLLKPSFDALKAPFG